MVKIMLCKNCNAIISEGEKFCSNCGAPVIAEETAAAPAPVENIASAPARPFTVEDLPEEYRPLSPWAYFGLQILYSIPIVGFIFLIIFSFKRSNINRRNFTRSYWCSLIVAGVIAIIAIILFAIFGMTAASIIESQPTLY
jgi:hypothetical protein